MSRKSIILAMAVCTYTFTLAQDRAEAQSQPFKISGGGIAPEGLPLPGEAPRSHWSVGAGTDLGIYNGEGLIETETVDIHPDGTITGEFGSAGPYVFTAADGDVLACYYGRTDFGASSPGTFELVPLPSLGQGVYIAFFVAEFVPYAEECTGKFAGVSGSWTMYAMTAPFVLGASDPVAYAWEGKGSLKFSNGR